MVDYLSFFYKESGADKDDIEDFADTILEAKIGTKVKKAEGGPVEIDLTMPRAFAMGGLSGGDKSGPPPERGPNPQGLLSLMKRGMRI